ncbi:hypothetical protein MARI_33820 (plasmid) [Marinobacter sp. JH2]|nr:restriction endonuclease subunit S [Marinobacter sp. JH2]QBM19236.1 hypothetical protein MARI_33820 [Marinobacter sp. JH2]
MTYSWFGPFKSKWKIVPLREIARLGTGHTPSREVEAYWENCTIPWVTVSDIRKHGASKLSPLRETEQKISELGLANSAAELHPPGTVMLSRTASIGFSCVIDKPMATTQAFVTWTPGKKLDSNYLHATLKAMTQLFDSMAYGATHLTIYFPDIKTLRIPLPSLEEQTQIARFLKHKTAKIDALIREQERLIELLQEKRQAVISHAVTKGLDPNVPMKDSGVEWLGEVPAHWEVRKVSYDFTAVKGPRGAILTKEYCAANQGPYPVYSGQTDNAGVLGSIDDFDFSLGSNGGLLTTTVGAKAMSLNFVTKDISLSQNCMLIRPISKQIFIKFYFYHLQPLFRLERAMIPDHMQPSFRMDDLYKFFVAQPPLKEQEAIALALDVEMGRFDALEREARLLIERLKERRSALISAAVTGKIDVRNWQPPSDESALDGSVRETGMESTP